MPAHRIEFTVSPDLAAAIDKARGDMPRATWIKRAVARELLDPSEGSEITELVHVVRQLREVIDRIERPTGTGADTV